LGNVPENSLHKSKPGLLQYNSVKCQDLTLFTLFVPIPLVGQDAGIS